MTTHGATTTVQQRLRNQTFTSAITPRHIKIIAEGNYSPQAPASAVCAGEWSHLTGLRTLTIVGSHVWLVRREPMRRHLVRGSASQVCTILALISGLCETAAPTMTLLNAGTNAGYGISRGTGYQRASEFRRDQRHADCYETVSNGTKVFILVTNCVALSGTGCAGGEL
jgi:hypothetical protein